MSYREVKFIKGKPYIYMRTSYRIGKIVKHTSKYIRPMERVRKRKKGAGRKPTLFVRKLTDDEISKLRNIIHSPEAFKSIRAKIILYSNEGKTVNEISQNLSVTRKTVTTAIKQFNEKTFGALNRKKAKGAKPKFTKEDKANILAIANTAPEKLNLPFTTWSLPKLQKYLIEKKIVKSITREWIRQILKKEGFKLKKSHRHQYSNDPEFAKKNFT